MNIKNIISITEARKKFFLIAGEVVEEDIHYTLTEYGRPKIVIVSATKFIALSNGVSPAQSPTRLSPYGSRMSSFVKESGAQKYGEEKPSSRKEKEMVKAQAYVELVEKCGYSFDRIDLGAYVSIGGNGSRRFLEVDMVVRDIAGNPKILFAVAPFGEYERDFEGTIRDLFEMANAITGGANHTTYLTHLVYYSRFFAGSRAQKKISVVDIAKNPTFDEWEKNGRPIGKTIPPYKK